VGIGSWFIPSRFDQFLLSPWRLVTPVFVHYTVFHFFTNAYVWWYFGSKLEERSRQELIVVFFVAAVLGNVAQWAVSGPKFGGLSGVTYALLAYCWTVSYLFKTNVLNLDKALSIILLALIPITATGIAGKYSDAAHVVGLVVGGVVGAAKYWLFRYRKEG
jgi:GlpG protein